MTTFMDKTLLIAEEQVLVDTWGMPIALPI